MLDFFKNTPRTILLNNNTKLSCIITNDNPNLKNIVLVNGSIFHLKQWDLFIRHGLKKYIQKKYRIIRYDYKGIGYSEKQNKTWDIWESAQELNSLLETLKIEKVFLYGISQGTLIIQAFAVLFPHKIIRIGGWGWMNICYSNLIDLHPVMLKRVRMLQQLKTVWDYPLDKKIFNHLWTLLLCKSIMKKNRKELNLSEKIISWFVKNKMYSLINPTPVKVIHDWFLYTITGLPLQKNKLRRKLMLLNDIPVLIQHAQYDDILPVKMAEELHSLLPNSQLSIYTDDYSHISVMFKKEQARVVAGEFIWFIEKT